MFGVREHVSTPQPSPPELHLATKRPCEVGHRVVATRVRKRNHRPRLPVAHVHGHPLNPHFEEPEGERVLTRLFTERFVSLH